MSHRNPTSRILLLAAFFVTATAWGASSCTPTGTSATFSSCTQSTGMTTTTSSGAAGQGGIAANVYPSILTVPANTLSGSVSKVVVKLNGLQHTVGAVDLGFLLVSPSGKSLLFMGGVGSFSAQSSVNVTFDDTSGTTPSCDFSTALSSGTLKTRVCDNSVPAALGGFPADGGNGWSGCTTNTNCPDATGPSGTSGTLTLTVFTQETNANGNWKLYMRDTASAQGTGTITSWGLDITTSGVASSATTTSISNVNPGTILRTTPGASDTAVITVSVTSSGGTVNAGTVTFTDNASALTCSPAATVSGNSATCNATFSSEGVHAIQATYGGTSGFASSNTASPTYALVVDRSTLTSVTTTGGQFCNAGGISIPTFGTPLVYPSNIYVTANGTPSGSTAFTGTLTGLTVSMASFTTTGGLPEVLLVSPTGKAYILVADAFGGSSGSGNITLSDAGGGFLPLNGSPSTGTFKPTDYNAGTAQDPAFFTNRNGTAVFNPSPAPTTGYFYPGGSGIGSATLQTTYGGDNPNGIWRLYAINSADGNAGSMSNWCVNLAVNPGAAATTTVISANPVQVFTTAPTQATTLTATVTSSSTVGLGSVTFSDNGTNLTCTNGSQPIAVSSGVATCSVASFATQGNHNITAAYNPAGSFGASSGVGVVRVDTRSTRTQQSPTGYIYCNPGTVTFPGLNNQAGTSSPYPVNVFVPDLPGTINTASVVYNNFHVNAGSAAHDFTSMLVGPNGGNSSSFDLMSRVGGIAENFTATVTLADSGASALPGSAISTGTYKPTSLGGANTYPSLIPAGPYPPPAGPFQYAASNGTSTFATIFGSGSGNTTLGDGTWSIFSQTVGNGTTGTIGSACVQFIVNPPVLAITKSHTGSFRQSSTGNNYTVHVTNNGPGPTGGTTTVVDDTTSAPGLAVTAMSGSNWTCTVGTKTCTSTDVIGAGNAFPDITVTVSVASNATSPQSNKANVSGGGSTATITATDATTILPLPVYSVAKSHSGNFTQGSTGVWTITVSNTAAAGGTTFGLATTVADTLPSGYTLASFSGTNWSCTGTGTANVSCSNSNIVDGGSSFPVLSLTVNVPAASATSVANSATASGGGVVSPATSNSDSVTVIQVPASIAINGSATQSTPVSTAFGSLAVTVKDANNVVIPNYSSVTFTASTGGNGQSGTFSNSTNTITLATAAVTGIANPGTFTANTKTGAYTVTVTAGPAPSATFNLTNTGGTATHFSVSAASPQTSGASFAVTVTALDASNNTATGYVGTVHLTSTDGAAVLPANYTFVSGDAGVHGLTVTLKTAGSQTVTSTDTVTSSITGTSNSIVINAGTAASMAANPGTTPQSATISTAFTNALAVTVKDANNNAISGVNVTFTAPASGASGLFSNSTNTITVATNASGIASAPITANATAGGPYTVTAAASGLTTVNFSLTNSAAAASQMTANAGTTPQSATISTAFANALAVTVKDAGNNPISGVNVTFTAPGSGASGLFSNSTTTITVATNASGIASAPFTANATAGGPYNVTAAASGLTTVNFSLTNSAAAASSMTANAGTTPQSTTISTAFTNALAVTVKDAGNNPVSGVNVTFTAPGAGASGVFSNSTATITVATNASGIASALFTANGTTGGPYNVTAAASGLTTVNFSLTNTAGAASSMTANAGTTPQTATINTAFTNALAVTIKDAGNNPISGVNVTFTAPGSGASGRFSNSTATITVATNASGIASAPFTANGTAGGPYNVTAAASGLTTVNFLLTNSTGAASSMTANAGTTPQSATVGTAFTNALAVTVKDAGNNPVSGVNVTFTAPGSGASGVFSNSTATITVATNASGIASAPITANATAGGPYTVTAAASGLTTVNFSLTNTAAPVGSMLANPGTTPQSTAVNTAFTNALSVTVKDAGNNPVSGANVTFTAPGSGASGLFSNSTTTITIATNASGIASAPFTANATVGGPYTVSAASAGLPNVNFSLTNTAGAAGSMTANAGTTPQATTLNTAFTNALAVTVKDAGNNPVSGVNVTFTAPGSGASGLFSNSTTTITVITNGSGIASAPFTANGTSGNYTVTASSAGLPNVNFSLSNGLTVTAFRVLWGPTLQPLSYDLVGSLRNRVPWTVTGIQVVFSAPVSAGNVNSLSGVTTTGVTGVGTNTLTWTINPITLGQFTATLAGTGGNALSSSLGALNNGVDGSQLLRVLYGDYNDDGVVNASDQTLVLNLVRAATYNLFGDMNGDTLVNNTDVQLVRNQIGTTLP